MKKLFSVYIAFLLVFLMVFNPCALDVIQEETQYDEDSLYDFPGLITEEIIQNHELLERCPEDEGNNLNMLSFQKEDDEKVAFFYEFDVKYIDSAGRIKDKNKKIVRDKLFDRTSYKTVQNDILSYFEIDTSGNVAVKTTYLDYSILSVAEHTDGSNIEVQFNKENQLTYQNAIGNGIHLLYSAEYNGVKEYIVLDDYNESSFEFTMTFNGLTPVLESYGGIKLVNSEGDTILSIPPVYVEDSSPSARSTYDNTMSLVSLGEDTYVLQINVDEDFLSNPDTVYPVYIDPYITVDCSYIEDTYVNEAYPDSTNDGGYSNLVGYSSTGSRYYTYVKFNFLNTALPYQNILSAYYQTYELSDRINCVLVEAVPASASWSGSTLTWNNQPYYHNEIIAKEAVGGNTRAEPDYDYGEYGMYRFYISNLVRGWMQGLPNYGFVLRTSYNSGWVKLSSNAIPYYESSLVIVYVSSTEYPIESDLSIPDEDVSFYLKNKRSGKYLTASGATTQGNVYQDEFSGSSNQKWTLESVGSGYYKIKLAETNYVLDVYCGSNEPTGNTNGTNIQLYPAGTGSNQKWKFVRNWNGTYQILSQLSNDTKGLTVYNASLQNGANCILYTHNVNFSYNDDWTLEPVSVNRADFFSFTNVGNYGIDTAAVMNFAKRQAGLMNIENRWNHVNVSASVALNSLKCTNLWYFRGHGGSSLFEFVSDNGKEWVRSCLYAKNAASDAAAISKLDSNALRNLYLVGSNSCLAGNSADYGSSDKTDLVGMIYRKGAHFVFATMNISHHTPNNEWCTQFFTEIALGKSFYQAIQNADAYMVNKYLNDTEENLYKAMRSCSRHYAGDGSIILYHV